MARPGPVAELLVVGQKWGRSSVFVPFLSHAWEYLVGHCDQKNAAKDLAGLIQEVCSNCFTSASIRSFFMCLAAGGAISRPLVRFPGPRLFLLQYAAAGGQGEKS